MKYISFCSGIEAATVAWHSLSWEPLAFCEIEKFTSRVLAHHYPQVPNLGDFTAVDWSQWTGKADVCVGGTPCQAFSVAGLRKSLSDERGNLSLEFIRAVNIIRPQYVVWENVPGVLSTADNAFGCFLAGLVGCEEPIVFEQGWPDAGVVDGPLRTACWRVLDAQYFGLAQRRRRVFVVASTGGGPHPAEILFEWESLRRDSAPRREAREGTARGIEIGPSGGGFTDINPTLDARAKDGPIRNQIAGAVAMCLNGGGMRRNDAESETLLPCIPLGLRNATRDPEKHDEQNRQGCGVGKDGEPCQTLTKEFVPGVAHSLRAEGHDASEDGTGRGTPLVVATVDMQSSKSNCLVGDGAVSPTLAAMHGHDVHAVAIQAVGFSCKDHGADAGDVALTLRSMGHSESHANGGGQVAVAFNLRGRDGGAMPEVSDVASLRAASGGSSRSYVAQMAVRRLTPTECERLQGFPDGYTAIPGAADGPRYKALGNSMAVPVMRWIGKRIKEASDAR